VENTILEKIFGSQTAMTLPEHCTRCLIEIGLGWHLNGIPYCAACLLREFD
jgi:hypothetical protein